MAASLHAINGDKNRIGSLPNHTRETVEKQTHVISVDENNIDYLQRAQWLRAALLGANDGLVSVSSLMMGVGAVKKDVTAMLLAGFAGLVAGACGMAIGEYVSVYTQYEVEICQMRRDMIMRGEKDLEMEMEKRALPNPFQAALASAFSFAIGALVPLLSAAFIRDYMIRLIVVVAMASLALVVFGSVGAQLGKTPKTSSCIRFLLGGWLAMTITFGLTKLFECSGMKL